MDELKQKYWPLLSEYTKKFGLKHYGFIEPPTQNFVETDVLLIDLVIRFLEKVYEPCGRWDPDSHSYRMKHQAEAYFNIYVPTGVMIAGCLGIGFEFRRATGGFRNPNAVFKIRIKKEYRKLFDRRQHWDHGEPMWAFLSGEIDQRSVTMYQQALAKLETDIPEGIANSDPRFNGSHLPKYYGCPKNLAWIKPYCTKPLDGFTSVKIP